MDRLRAAVPSRCVLCSLLVEMYNNFIDSFRAEAQCGPLVDGVDTKSTLIGS